MASLSICRCAERTSEAMSASFSRSFLRGSAGMTGHLALVIASMTFLPRALPPGWVRKSHTSGAGALA